MENTKVESTEIENTEKGKRRRKREKYTERTTINVSLQKRNAKLLNSILINWEKEGYNISNEVCEAIIFKNRTNINPHICTILSTLSLIESSIKSQQISKQMTEEEIDTKALEIFNEVITIDIDGNKLTNLLKAVNLTSSTTELSAERNINSEDIKISNNISSIEIERENSNKDNYSENIIEEKKLSITANEAVKIEPVQPKESKEINEKASEPLVWSNFPEEKIGDKNSKSNNLFSNFATQSGFITT